MVNTSVTLTVGELVIAPKFGQAGEHRAWGLAFACDLPPVLKSRLFWQAWECVRKAPSSFTGGPPNRRLQPTAPDAILRRRG
ncbi:hypothetical protein TBR22_A16060 [Luteitalea sp. TBR-22]|nr:hypothetical protein TBR22_A16060 [Luteitalea sp. TBR-22]